MACRNGLDVSDQCRRVETDETPRFKCGALIVMLVVPSAVAFRFSFLASILLIGQS
jgi:hypothetical protein